MQDHYQPFPAFSTWLADVDLTSADAAFARLAAAKDEATPAALAAAVNVATRYAAVDTGALEGLYTTTRGFTRTIAEQTATWEAALGQHPASVRHAIEDQLEGYEMVLDAVTRAQPVTATWIRQLHEVICRSEETHTVITPQGWQEQRLAKGAYKTQPNNPTSSETGRVHHYAPPGDVPAEVGRLIDELSSTPFSVAHPVVQAAYAHYAFVCIHPFADGNGRVARALASVYLYRNPGVPLVIFADQRSHYLDALEAADAGNPTPFTTFIRDCGADAAELLLVTVTRPGASTQASLDRLRSQVSRGGLPPAEFDDVAARVASKIRSLVDAWASSNLTAPVNLSQSHMRVEGPTGYRPIPSPSGFEIRIEGPGESRHQDAISVWAARATTDVWSPDLVVLASQSGSTLGIQLREVYPTETTSFDLRLSAWVEGVLDEGLGILVEQHEKALRAQGYI